MKTLVPLELHSPRLLLRQFREDDWLALHQYYVDEIATRFTVGHAFSVGETWRTLSSIIAHWAKHGYGPYALETKHSAKLIGTAGFWYPNDFPGPEIKWSLLREYWGQGYASEAARAVQQCGLAYLPDIALMSMIHPDNANSIKVALAIGAKFEKSYNFREMELHLYRHPPQSGL